jgi:hypothetical protein
MSSPQDEIVGYQSRTNAMRRPPLRGVIPFGLTIVSMILLGIGCIVRLNPLFGKYLMVLFFIASTIFAIGTLIGLIKSVGRPRTEPDYVRRSYLFIALVSTVITLVAFFA